MERRFVFLTSGMAHSAYFVVNVHTLRKYDNATPIHAYVWPESYDLHKKIAEDERLGIEVFPWEPEYRGKNCQFFNKLLLMQSLSKKSVNCYLDSDLSIHGNLDELFYQAEGYGFAATQFCQWKTNEGHAKNRVSNLREIEGIPQEHVLDSIINPHPSVNGGVFACQPDSPALKDWIKWTDLVKQDLFIADETVLHVVCRKWEPKKYLTILRGGLYNQSPMKKFRPKDQRDEAVLVFHYHGDNCTRPDTKGLEPFQRWYPLFQECLELNLGGIQDWVHSIGNRHLKRTMEQVEKGELHV